MSQTFNDAVPAITRDALSDLTAIRNNFAALKSCFSGASAPANPVTGMWWVDTTAHQLKQRNEANDAWINVFNLASGYAYGCSNTVVAGTGISVSGSLQNGDVTVSLASGGISNAHVANSTLGSEKLQTGTDERNWVLSRTAGASVGAVGTYAFAYYDGEFGDASLGPGDTVSGSKLRYAGMSTSALRISSTSLSGTWRCMGYAPINIDVVTPGNSYWTATLFLRIS